MVWVYAIITGSHVMEYNTETRAAPDRQVDRNALLVVMALLLLATVGLFIAGGPVMPFALLAGGVGLLGYARLRPQAEGASTKRWWSWAGFALIGSSFLWSAAHLIGHWMA